MGMLALQFICLGLAATYEINAATLLPERSFFGKWWRTIICTGLLILQMGAYFVEKAANAALN